MSFETTLSPEDAANLVPLFADYEGLDRTRMLQYSRMIRYDLPITGKDPIKFSSNLLITNGRHRILAVLHAHKPLTVQIEMED